MSVTATTKALYSFFSGFGLPVYGEDDVPDRDPATGEPTRPPYITVQRVTPSWRDSAHFYAHLWYRSNTYAEIDAKADEIGDAIGECASVEAEGGAIYLYKGRPFAQHRPVPGDRANKCIYLNLTLMSHTP